MSNQLTDAAIEALDHTVGLRMARTNQAMIYAEIYAGQVKCMLARRCPFLAGELVRELSAVVGEDRLDVHRRGIV